MLGVGGGEDREVEDLESQKAGDVAVSLLGQRMIAIESEERRT